MPVVGSFREADAGANLGTVKAAFLEAVESADLSSIEAACNSTEWSAYGKPAVVAVSAAFAKPYISALDTAFRQAHASAV